MTTAIETPVVRVSVPGTPVSVNHYKNSAAGGWAKRKPARAWLDNLKASLIVDVPGPLFQQATKWEWYDVTLRVFLGKAQKGDIDNFAKLTLDGLVTFGVIRSDAAVVRLVMELGRDWNNPRTEIEVREAVR